MHRHFNTADYEVALAHELTRLHTAALDAGLTPRRMPSIRWIDKKPGRTRGHWALSMPVREFTFDGEDYGSLDVTATAPTLGAVFEAAHYNVRQRAREAV